MSLTEDQMVELVDLVERHDSVAVNRLVGGWIQESQAAAWEQGWRASANAMLSGLSLVNPFREGA